MMAAPSSTWFTTSPDWGWIIVLYLFFGSLAGGSYFLAAMIDLFGRREDRPLARLGYFATFACLIASGICLLSHLYRPDRFWHLFIEIHTWRPMFEYWVPMSTGGWAVITFSALATLSFLAALAESRAWSGHRAWSLIRGLRAPGAAGIVITVLGTVAALYAAGYPGVLLAVTNRPIWADTPLIGMLLSISAISIAAGLLLLLSRLRHRSLPGRAALFRMVRWLIALEFLALLAVVVSLGPAARGWMNGWGVLLFVGVVLIGMVLPMLLHRYGDRPRLHAMTAVPVLVLGSGLLLRAIIVLSSESL